MKRLIIIIPSVKGEQAYPSIESALTQVGFDQVHVIVAGKSVESESLRCKCSGLNDCVHFDTYTADRILPGKARNRGLEVAANQLKADSGDYILFLDDDIILPPEFSLSLNEFLETFSKSVAVMGRVESRPVNFWNQIIDYSNFYWLQVKRHLHDLGWLGAGATMIKFSDINGRRFNESLSVGEDTDFFIRIATAEGRTLSVNALATCEHFHGRDRFVDFVRYQYGNGYRHSGWYSNGLSVLHFLKQFSSASFAAIKANKRYLMKRPHILLGVFFSFFVCFWGTQIGSIHDSKS